MKEVAKERIVDRKDGENVETAIFKVVTRDLTEPSYLDFQANPHIRGVSRSEERRRKVPGSHSHPASANHGYTRKDSSSKLQRFTEEQYGTLGIPPDLRPRRSGGRPN